MAGSDVLVWLDMEMTGLDPATERIIEIATILTDGQLTEIAVGPELVIRQSDEILAAMDDWNTKHHGGSGLIARVKESAISDADAEAQTIAFINAHVSAKERPVGIALLGLLRDDLWVPSARQLLDGRDIDHPVV